MTIALDISFHTKDRSGDLTTKQLDDAWSAGVRAFRPNVNPQQVCVEQIDAIVNYGDATGRKFEIWPYSYYYFANILEQADEDIAFIQRVRNLKYDVQLFSLDIEDTNPNFNPSTRSDLVAQLIPK